MVLALSKAEVLRRLFPDGTGLEELFPLLEERQYDPGYRILMEGDATDKTMHFIAAGEVEITRDPFGSGQPQLIGTLTAGDIVGEMAVVDNLPRNATATAKGEVTTYALTSDNWYHVMAFYPGLAAHVQYIASHRASSPAWTPQSELADLTAELRQLARDLKLDVSENASARDIVAALRARLA